MTLPQKKTPFPLLRKGRTDAVKTQETCGSIVSFIRTIPSALEFHQISTARKRCGRGLYRRWGISPRPETDFNHIINHAKKKSSLAVFFYPKIERPTFIELQPAAFYAKRTK